MVVLPLDSKEQRNVNLMTLTFLCCLSPQQGKLENLVHHSDPSQHCSSTVYALKCTDVNPLSRSAASLDEEFLKNMKHYANRYHSLEIPSPLAFMLCRAGEGSSGSWMESPFSLDSEKPKLISPFLPLRSLGAAFGKSDWRRKEIKHQLSWCLHDDDDIFALDWCFGELCRLHCNLT